MHPGSWSIELAGRSLVLGPYSISLILAAATVVVGALLGAFRRGLPVPRVLAACILGVLGGVAGARLLNLLLHAKPLADAWNSLANTGCGQFSLYGGFLGGGIATALAARLLTIPARRLADAMAVPLLVGIAVARVGCFLQGCCFGTETDLPWGVVFPRGSPAHVYQMSRHIELAMTDPMPVHPTQLYELFAALVAGGIAIGLRRRYSAEVQEFLVAMLVFTAFRWLILLMRVPLYAVPAWTWLYSTLHATLVVIGGIAFYRSLGKRRPDINA